MKKPLLRFALFVLCVSTLSGCSQVSDSLFGYSDGTGEWQNHAPRENPEVEQMALYLSRQSIAPQDMYERIAADLDTIRKTFIDTIPLLATMQNEVPWIPGYVTLHVDTLTYAAMQAGEYTAWSNLNSDAGVENMLFTRKTDEFGTASFYVGIIYNSALHPYHVAAMYEKLPGVNHAALLTSVTDPSFIHRRVTSSRRVYYFRRHKAGGMCGYPFSYWWIVEIDDEGVHLVGERLTHKDGWEEETQAIWTEYHTYYDDWTPD